MALCWLLDMAGIGKPLMASHFLPSADEGHVYEQAPYEDITKEQYKEMSKGMPKSIDWSLIVEEVDNTTSSQEVACTAGSCEI